jgi:hypothetical protein
MLFHSNKDLKRLVEPISFALKQGPCLDKNLMDFSLIMLHHAQTETIASPKEESPLRKEFFLKEVASFREVVETKKRQPPFKAIEPMIPHLFS